MHGAEQVTQERVQGVSMSDLLRHVSATALAGPISALQHI